MNTRRLPNSALIAALTLLVILPTESAGARQTAARPPPGRIGVGLQAGPFSGFSIKGYPRPGTEPSGPFESAVLTGQMNFSGFVYFQAVLLDETELPDSPLTLYLGPGVALGIDDGQMSAGLAGVAGVRFFRSRVEVYLELAPRLILVEERQARPSAAVGFRVYPGRR